MEYAQGRVVRVELQSTDLTTGTPVKIYDEDANEVTLQPHERLILREVHISSEQSTDDVTLFDDADDDNVVDDGERLFHVGSDTTGTTEVNRDRDFGPEGIACAIGIPPHVIASAAGEVVLTGTGYIVDGKTPTARLDWKEADFGQ